jgi:hypothetical protein
VSVSTVLALAISVCSLIGSLYVLMRVGFRVEELWRSREQLAEAVIDIAVLQAKVRDLQTSNLNRGEAEARVKRLVKDRN